MTPSRIRYTGFAFLFIAAIVTARANWTGWGVWIGECLAIVGVVLAVVSVRSEKPDAE
jgi:hypothetical protein